MPSKKVFSVSFICSLILMIAAPFVAVRLINGEGGFAFTFLQFLWINPIFCAINGAVAGRDIKENWSIIFFPVALFLLSARIVFSAAISEFTIYSLMYIGVGAATMFISALIARSSKKKKPASSQSSTEQPVIPSDPDNTQE